MRRALSLLLLLVPAAAGAQQTVNPIHPVFVPLDADRAPVARSGRPVSAEATCGRCHDATYIADHDSHRAAGVHVECTACHYDGGRLVVTSAMLDPDGRLVRDAVRIGRPQAANCAACHGVVLPGGAAVALPDDFEAPRTVPGWPRAYDLTENEGAIVSPDRVAESLLDVAGKDALDVPWDVHAARLVDCVDCHYARNNPVRTDDKRRHVEYVPADPRRTPLAEFLYRPDHRLAAPDCRACHDATAVHDFLPYRARHMEVLACQACHVPAPRGPALQMVDATAVTTAGRPLRVYRNVERRGDEPLNAASIVGLDPLLVPAREPDGLTRLEPFNLVSRWRWLDAATGAEVAPELVAQAWLARGAYAPELVAAFDADHDGRLDPAELRLDRPAKAEAVAARLRALGVAQPVIGGTIHAYPLAHGVMGPRTARRECTDCHSRASEVTAPFALAAYVPGGVAPRLATRAGFELAGTIGPDGHGGLAFSRGDTPPGTYVLGRSRHALTNTIGFALFLLVVVGCALHGVLRLAGRRRRGPPPERPVERLYVFSRFERVWHVGMVLSVTVLALTGIEIHRPGTLPLFGLATTVRVHNFFAGALAVVAFLAMFYYAATAAIRQFIPQVRGFWENMLRQLHYYTFGIFRDAAHPMRKTADRKLNPLQQVTYLVLLNVLFPLQIVSGLLIWAVSQWPDVAASLGGLSFVAPLHNLGAWLFLSFYALHHYLLTTGHDLLSTLRSMITGYDLVETDEPNPPEGKGEAS